MRALRMTRSLKSFRGLRLLVQACNSFFPSLVPWPGFFGKPVLADFRCRSLGQRTFCDLHQCCQRFSLGLKVLSV
ncbi:unnamed protein product [Symbiodinium sp. CCMP2456]|nr:unnamed protein product [Symbiodinium sp. CCMP2456]